MSNDDMAFIALKVLEFRVPFEMAVAVVDRLAVEKMYAALKAIDAEGRDANANGDVTIPSHVWDLVAQALAKAEGHT